MASKFIDVFGKKIGIPITGCVTTITKNSESCVTIKLAHESGYEMSTPVFTSKDYKKTADEFIAEFNKQLTKNKL